MSIIAIQNIDKFDSLFPSTSTVWRFLVESEDSERDKIDKVDREIEVVEPLPITFPLVVDKRLYQGVV